MHKCNFRNTKTLSIEKGKILNIFSLYINIFYRKVIYRLKTITQYEFRDIKLNILIHHLNYIYICNLLNKYLIIFGIFISYGTDKKLFGAKN